MRPDLDDGTVRRERQAIGDESLLKALQYENALRCQWLLELRATSGRLSVATGEDATITRPDGTVVYRQVKKKEGGKWNASELADFLRDAWARFSKDRRAKHELFTNAPISSDLRSGRPRGRFFRLNPHHNFVAKLGGNDAQAFADSVTLHQQYLQPDSELLLDHLLGRVRRSIERAFPSGANVQELLSHSEVSDVVSRLLQAGLALQPKSEVSWRDIDHIARLDNLIEGLPLRALGDGSFKPLNDYVEKGAQLANDEQAEAVRASLEGRNLKRPVIDESVMSLVEKWAHAPANDYRVIVLEGAPGSGKTWTLLRLGLALCRRPDLQVLNAADTPQAERLPLRHLGVLAARPCVILVDGLFPDWSDHIKALQPPLAVPLLFLATVDSTCDSADLAILNKKRGSRIERVIQVPQSPDESELVALAALRGVALARREKTLGMATTFLHAAHLLSGIEPTEHLQRLRAVAGRPDHLDCLTAIWAVSRYRVPLPRGLLERFLGRALPSGLGAWLIRLPGERLVFEDPEESESLLQEMYGDAKDERVRSVYLGLLGHVDARQGTERAFARRLFRRLVRDNIQLASEILEECADVLPQLIASEAPWGLVFSWLPTFAATRRSDLEEATIQRLASKPPASVAEQLLWLHVYEVDDARTLLRKTFQRLANWRVDEASDLVSAIMRIDDAELQREVAQRLTSWFLDLSEPVAFALLAKRLSELLALVSDWAEPEARTAVLGRTAEFLAAQLHSNVELKQNWLQSYLSLADHVVRQPRFGLSLGMRRALLAEDMGFPVRDRYVECLERERSVRTTSVVDLGARLLPSAEGDASRAVPIWAGNFLEFVGTWADDEEWQKGVAAVLGFVEGLQTGEVPVDRVGLLLMSLFGPIRRGPRHVAERFLRDMLSWLPGKEGSISVETGKLLMHVIAFTSAQSWLSQEVRSLAKVTLLALATSDEAPGTAAQLFQSLCRELGVQARPFHASFGLAGDWSGRESIANTYLSRVWRLKLGAEEEMTLGNQLTSRWGPVPWASQQVLEALLRLNQTAEAKTRVEAVIRERPDYPDSYAHLAICWARVGLLDEARDQLKILSRIWDSKKTGLHPYLAAWMHSELAQRTEGRERMLHLICAELSRDRRLREYDDVIES